MIDYGIDYDGDMFCSVYRLHRFLNHSTTTCGIRAAVSQLASVSREDFENPFVILPTEKDVDYLVSKSKAKEESQLVRTSS